MSRFRPKRVHLLFGLVVVLLATVPVLVPLVWTRASGASGADVLRLAAGPGLAPMPQGGVAPPASAKPTSTRPAPAGAGTLASAAPTTPSASPATPTSRAPESASTPPPPVGGPATASATPDPGTATPDPTGAPAVLAAGSDLVVVSVGWTPDPAGTGQSVVFSAVVQNVGSDATPAVTHGISFSVDGTKVSWSANSSDPLGPGESRTYVADGGPAGNTWAATPGVHTVEAWADDLDRIPEISNDNNTGSALLTVS